MDPDLDALTALELAEAIRGKQVAPTEVMDTTLAAIDQRNPALNAVIWLDEDDARRRAAAATERLAAGDVDDLPPFFGVPMPIKDLTPVSGAPLTYGSPGASDEPAEVTAVSVERMEAAGFLLCGRTNTPEFGTITATENDRYGITRNPWDLDRTPGGSSGGASAALAGGMFTIAHGSDGGGSIRIPASCTGLVGLKPARGRVPGLVVAWEGGAVEGAITRTVADAAAFLDVVSGPHPLGWWNAPTPDRPFSQEVGADPGRLRVLVSTEVPIDVPIDPECRRAAEQLGALLADAGHEIVDGTLEVYGEQFARNFGQVVDAGLAGLPVDWDRVQPYNRHARDRARAIDSLSYVDAVMGLQLWTRAFVAQWGRDFDLLVTPTMAVQPPVAGELLREITDDPATTPTTVLQMVAFTSVCNMSGLPAVSLPVHVADDTGLPVGAQLVAGPWREDVLLRVGSQVEEALPDWRDRRPRLDALTGAG